MRFQCALFTVKDVSVSKAFYRDLLGQKLRYDFGENIVFEGDFSFQEKDHFAQMVSVDSDSIVVRPNNAELYFETDDFDDFIKRIKQYGDMKIEFLHPVRTHDWGQRTIRFYDPDGNIVEVGESMDVVIGRFLKEGYSLQQVAEITQHPIRMVQTIHNELYVKGIIDHE
ncbi:MAG: VOC family protein [Anaerofustis sp.]